MRKPTEQWYTGAAAAVRVEGLADPAFAGDARAEQFELRYGDGRVGRATFGLTRQVVDAVAAADPGIAFAARAWLAARGQRAVNLYVADDTSALAAGTFTVRDLASAVGPSPRRLITLAPSNVEMVHALGCVDRVIACDVSSDFPPGLDQVERLGQDLAPDLDRIEALAPDLVVSSLTVPGMERVVTGLASRGVPQIVLAPKAFDDVLNDARDLGVVLGVPARGVALARSLEAERTALARRTSDRVRARVYLEWWPKPMFTPGRDCYSNELIELAGGINVFRHRPGSSVEISAADVVGAQPDVCFVSWCGVAPDKLNPEHLIRRPGLEALSAARAAHVYPLDEAFSGRPGPRMLEASRIMADAIEEVG
jgi:iron complex transport system substrate-binding protein